MEKYMDFIVRLLYSITMNIILIAFLVMGVIMMIGMHPELKIAAIIVAVIFEIINIWMTIVTFDSI